MSSPQTLLQKIWRRHQVTKEGQSALLTVDRLYLDESAFNCFHALRSSKRKVSSPENVYLMVSHLAPIRNRHIGQPNADIRRIYEHLEGIHQEFGVHLFRYTDPAQGIYHVVGPEQGLTLPGLIIAATDSHATTHGALGALSFGVGYEAATQVLATDTLWHSHVKSMLVTIGGTLHPSVSAKDLALHVVGKIGAVGATGYCIEFAGKAVSEMSVEGRMTLCNMGVEAGARAALIAPDETTIDYVSRRPQAPKGSKWDLAVDYWRSLGSDEGAVYDRSASLNASEVLPMVTWGTSPDQVVPISEPVPDPSTIPDPAKRRDMLDALAYMDIAPGTFMDGLPIDQVFIGSCTNGRIEDLRAAAAVVKGRRIIVPGLIAPGSMIVKAQAEAEGLHQVFRDAGFEWGSAGCSLCLGLFDHVVPPGVRCASTTNRNFKNRQGRGSRTHLMSPAMVAAAAVMGMISDVRKLGR